MRSSLASTYGILSIVLSTAALGVSAPRLVADLATVPSPTDGSRPHDFATVGSYVVFAAQPDDHADRLYRSSGTSTGTEELAAPCGPLEQGFIELLFATPPRAYFSAWCGNALPALWTSDGTAPGTIALLGPEEFHPANSELSKPAWAVELNYLLFLQGGDATRLELWRTDGTVAGTLRLAVLSLSENAIGALARLSRANFMALVGSDHPDLSVWTSDGTVTGTVEVTALDLYPPSFSVRSFAATAGGIDFMADVGNPVRRELWRSDGTTAGTLRLAEFDSQIPDRLVDQGGAVYFTAAVEGQNGIWRSDGTEATTRRIVDLAGRDVLATSFAFLDDRIFYLAFDTARTTAALFGAATEGGEPVEIASVCDQTFCLPEDEDQWLLRIGETLVYERHEGEVSSIWKSDGSVGSAVALTPRCNPDECHRTGVAPIVLEDRLFFSSWTSGEAARELWTCDGSPEGTYRLGLWPALSWVGWFGGPPIAALPDGSGWLFAAGESEHGLELWHARRQANSGALVADLRLDRPSPVALEVVGMAGASFLFSLPIDYDTRTLYRHDSGGEGVEAIFNLPIIRGRYGSLNPPPTLREAGGAWYFFESDFDGDDGGSSEFAQQVWRFDPISGEVGAVFEDHATTGSGALAHDLFPSKSDYVLLGTSDGDLHPAIYRLQPRLRTVSSLLELPAEYARSVGRSGNSWFLLEDGSRLVVFDLERRSRAVLADFSSYLEFQLAALSSGALIELVRVDPNVWNGYLLELWQSDGTAAGTREIASWQIAEGCGPQHLFSNEDALNPFLFSVHPSCSSMSELWISDGSAERTQLLRTISGQVIGFDGSRSRFAGELYFFTAEFDPGTYGWQAAIWKTNGTPEETREVAALPANQYFNPDQTVSGARGDEGIYFPWFDDEHGIELWRTDGTAGGTGFFADLEPGSASSVPWNLHTVGDQVLFNAATSLSGAELWQVDGGLVTPQLVADLYPGPEGSSPVVLAASDAVLYFQADDGLVGREIWEVSGPSVAPCVSSATTLCLADGRFRARAVRRDFEGEMGAAGAVPLTGDSGCFWFFAPGNPEVILKIVDACGLPGFENFWAYSTGLTNVEVELDVVDTWSGERQSVRTVLGEAYGPLFDSGSFHVCGGGGPTAPRAAARELPPAAPSGLLPLLDGRFEATATWAKRDGTSGDGQAVPISSDSGYFWFFTPSIVEVLVKMVDACGTPGFDNYWLFAGGLTDVEVHLTVRDTLTGEVVSHDNAQGHPFTPLLETGRLRVCLAPP